MMASSTPRARKSVELNAKLMLDGLHVFDDELEKLAVARQGRYATKLSNRVLGDVSVAQTPRLLDGACPGNEESTGVNYSHRCPTGNRQMRRVLNQAANAAAKAKGSIFAIVYRRLVPRLGHAQAI